MDFVIPVLIAGTILMVVFLLWGFYLNRNSHRECLNEANLGTGFAEDPDPFNGELPNGGIVREGPRNPLLSRQVDIELGARSKPIAHVRVPRTSANAPEARLRAKGGRRSAPPTVENSRVRANSISKKTPIDVPPSVANISQFRVPAEKPNRPPLKSREILMSDPRSYHSNQDSLESDALEFTWLLILAKNRERTIEGEDLNRLFRRAGLEWDPIGSFYQVDRRSRERTFDVNNVLRPAEFPGSDLTDFVTAGLFVYLELGRVANPSNSFEMALRFAKEAANVLPDVEVCDNQKVPLCEQRIQKYRQVVAEFSRERLSVAQ